MNFDLSEDQELFKATAERFVAPVDLEARKKIRDLDGGYDRARWIQLAELGFLALAADKTQGGIGGSLLDLAVIAEAFGRGNAVDPWLENAALPIRLLSKAGIGDGLESYLNGSKIAAFAFAEPGGRYNLEPKLTNAKQTAEGFTLSGEKNLVLGGALADSFIVIADLNGEIAFFLVPADSQDVHHRPYRIADGSEAVELFVRNAALPADAKLELDHAELNIIVTEIRLLANAEMVGLSQRLLDDTVKYVKEREQFGVAIGSFQAIQHRLVDCYAALEQMRSMHLRTLLATPDASTQWHAAIAGAKAFVSVQSADIAKRAVQYHGGMGITDDLAIGHAVKRLLILSRLFGDAHSNLKIYAEAA